jgi:muramidase (phage lysozyme)
MADKITIPAIHDDDLEKLLASHHMLDKLKNGEINCIICDTKITWDNIYGLMIKDNQPKLICDSTDCLERLNNQS